MNPAIIHPNLANEYWTEELCYIVELSNSATDPDLSIAQARVEPGVTTRWHRLHDTAERYYILQGSGRVEIGDQQPEDVSAGDVVLIPAMCPQRIANTGSTDLIFLALCTPAFKDTVYEDIEDRRGV